MTRWILKRHSVLVLNRNWQAINVKTPLEALSMMFSDDATGLQILGLDNMVPLKWNDWVNLPHNDSEEYVHTVRGDIRIPKIIILSNFDKVPKKRPKFTSKNLWQRDEGICQYTGRKLKPNEGNIDHVLPKSRGGRSTWTNCVLSHKDVNAEKGNRTPSEAGLRLIRQPKEPQSLPTTFYIENRFNIKEWDAFLFKEQYA
jgi:5-methylcytosine-specific restriction endonuclease McrA